MVSALARSLIIGGSLTGKMFLGASNIHQREIASGIAAAHQSSLVSGSLTTAAQATASTQIIPAQITDTQHSGLNLAAVIGLCVGVSLVGLALIGLFCYRKQQQSRFRQLVGASPNIEKRPLNKRSDATLSHRREISTDGFDFGGLVPTVQAPSRFSTDGNEKSSPSHNHIPFPEMQYTNMPRGPSPIPNVSRTATLTHDFTGPEKSSTPPWQKSISQMEPPQNNGNSVRGLRQSFRNYPAPIHHHTWNDTDPQPSPTDTYPTREIYPMNHFPRGDLGQYSQQFHSSSDLPRSQSAMAMRSNGPHQIPVLRSESALDIRYHRHQKIQPNFPFSNSSRQQLVVNRQRPLTPVDRRPLNPVMFNRNVTSVSKPLSPPPSLQPSPARSPVVQSPHRLNTPPSRVLKQGRRASPPSPLSLPPVLPSHKDDDVLSLRYEDFASPASETFALPQISPTTSPPKVPTPALPPSVSLTRSPSVQSVVSTSSSILDQPLTTQQQWQKQSHILKDKSRLDIPSTPGRTPSLAAKTAWAEKRMLLKGLLDTKDQKPPVPAVSKYVLSASSTGRASYNSPTESMFDIYESVVSTHKQNGHEPAIPDNEKENVLTL